MTVTLGAVPQQMTLALVEGGDFVCTLVSGDGDWPATAQVAIDVGGQTWAGTLAGADARFDVDKALVATVIAAKPRRFTLRYVDGTTDLTWGVGPVVITRA